MQPQGGLIQNLGTAARWTFASECPKISTRSITVQRLRRRFIRIWSSLAFLVPRAAVRRPVIRVLLIRALERKSGGFTPSRLPVIMAATRGKEIRGNMRARRIIGAAQRSTKSEGCYLL